MNETKKDMFDFSSLVETCEVEMKKAAGRDGKGTVPDSIWETYSAMSNTSGGIILLGAEEIPGSGCKICHLENAERMVRNLWNTLNDRSKVSKNLLQEKDIQIHISDSGEKFIVISVPQASRKDKPVFINNQMFGGTYKRFNEGDYQCPDDLVKQMLSEQISETMDDVIISGYSIDDIDQPTFNAYRQRFSNRKPDHPFNIIPPLDFLRQIGGYREDRKTGESGLTLAGLLMFGKLRDILDNVPNYVLDYQERLREISDLRWLDRITTDFSWPGNLFSFYQMVIPRLFSDLKVPFRLKNATESVEDTPVHKAIREAFVNTLIHADYRGKCSILVIKRPDLFGFRNPGTFRLPKAEMLRGGCSDCRNRNLQKMFQLVGLAEQAGSGIPKIYYGWNSQDWKQPEYEEKFESNQTVLALRMTSLLPEETVAQVQKTIGINQYRSLTRLERLIAVTAFAEGCVNHARIMNLTTEHGADISAAFRRLLQKKILSTQGHGPAAIYYPAGHPPISDDINCCGHVPPVNVESSSSPLMNMNSQHNDDAGCHHITGKQGIGNNEELIAIAAPVRNNRRTDPLEVETVIVKLCQGRFLSMSEIAFLIKRGENTVRNHYLSRLCKSGALVRQYPTINDPRQRYTAGIKKGSGK